MTHPLEGMQSPVNIEEGLLRPLEALIYEIMQEQNLAGASVALVRAGFTVQHEDGGGGYVPPLAFSRGYGYGDTTKSEVVDPLTTLFNTGSCARILAAMAAMQLRQEEALDDMADVNRYLPEDLRVDSLFKETASLSHLLTHTSGFCDRANDAATSSSSLSEGLMAALSVTRDSETEAGGEESRQGYGGQVARFLRDNLKTGVMRVSPPGTIYRECAYNSLLVGAMVECVSGLDYPKYVMRRLAAPLRLRGLGAYRRGVRGAGLQQPTMYVADRATGQRTKLPAAQGRQVITPITGLAVTADDMSRLLLAMVQGISEHEPGGGGGVLSDSSLRQMHRKHFANHQVELAYGLMRRKVWASGATMLYHSADEANGADSIICLLPDQRVGLWVSTNTTPRGPGRVGGRLGGERFCERVVEKFLATLYGKSARAAAPSPQDEVSRWCQPVQPTSIDPLMTIFCFPYAAGSAPLIYETWSKSLPDFIQVVAVQLPGRGTRVKDAPCSDLCALAEDLGGVLLSALPRHPVVFFGHGMGAVLAYEVARFLHVRHDRCPAHLLISGSACAEGPHPPGNSSAPRCCAEEGLSLLTIIPADAGGRRGGTRGVARRGGGAARGIPRVIRPPSSTTSQTRSSSTRSCAATRSSHRIPRHFRRNSLMLRAMLGTLRADLAAEETYEHDPNPHYATPPKSVGLANGALAHTYGVTQKELRAEERKLPCPMTVYLGVHEDQVGDGGAEAWGELGAGPVTVHRLPGDHFYLEEVRSQELLLRAVTQAVARRMTRHTSWISMMTAGPRVQTKGGRG